MGTLGQKQNTSGTKKGPKLGVLRLGGGGGQGRLFFLPLVRRSPDSIGIYSPGLAQSSAHPCVPSLYQVRVFVAQ